MTELQPRVEAAIIKAVDVAVKAVGINGLRKMSMFPSSQREVVNFKIAA